MTLRVLETDSAVASAAAAMIVASARDAIEARGLFTFALSGGSTPRDVFQLLARGDSFTKDLVAKTHLFWGDERGVPNEHADSNVRMAREAMIDALAFPPENVHAPNGGAADLDAEARRYEEIMRRIIPAGAGGLPAFDLNLLGMGTDGHTASLFPGTRALTVTNRIYVANEVPQLKTNRLTMTYEAHNASRQILILITGDAKAGVLGDIFGSRPVRDKYPIQRIRPDALWLLDDAAARRIPESANTESKIER